MLFSKTIICFGELSSTRDTHVSLASSLCGEEEDRRKLEVTKEDRRELEDTKEDRRELEVTKEDRRELDDTRDSIRVLPDSFIRARWGAV